MVLFKVFVLNIIKTLTILLCLGFQQLSSQVIQNNREDSTFLPEVIIRGNSIQEKLRQIPAAVNVLDSIEINRGNPLSLTASFNRKPGVFVQQGALNTNRITLRGIGSRAQYGTNRIKVYIDDIPITTGDGQSVLNDIDVNVIDRIEIIKGPNSSIYGSGLGGVINLYTKTSSFQNFAAVTSYFGSYGLLKNSIRAGYGNKTKSFFATYNHVQSEGYRENSAYDRKSFTINGKIVSGENGDFTFLGNFTRLKSHIASSIDATDFNQNPQKVAFTWKNAKGYESYDKLLLGLAYHFSISEKIENTTSVFLNVRDAYEPRPFDILKEKSYNLGAWTHFNYHGKFSKMPLKVSLGGEFLSERYNGSKFENLYEDYPEKGSVRGNIFSDIDQDRTYYNGFLQANLRVSPKLKITAGLNVNATNYQLTNLFNENQVNQPGKYHFKTAWSPRFAALYEWSTSKSLYANISKGFSVPSVDETLTPEGTINTSLQPETGWNYEIGFKGTWFKNLYTELAFYTIQVSDLLVARRVAEDQYVGLNAGETDHNGVELLLNYNWKFSEFIQVKPYFSAEWNDYRFDEFVDEGIDYSGNDLTGVPDQKINLGVDIQLGKHFSFFSNWLQVSQIPLNDANTVFSENYQVTDLKASYSFKLLKVLETSFSVGINNLFDEQYAASILPNAIGFNGSEPRYFYPGNPRNYFGGVGVKWIF